MLRNLTKESQEVFSETPEKLKKNDQGHKKNYTTVPFELQILRTLKITISQYGIVHAIVFLDISFKFIL